MTTRILLEYPDGTPVERIRNDLIDLARAEGASGQRPAMSIAGDDAEQVEYIQTRMAQARNGQTIAVTGGTVTLTVAANVVTAAYTAS